MTFILEIKGSDGKTRSFRIEGNAQLGRRHDGMELVMRTGGIEEDLRVLDQNVSREHLDMELVSGGDGLKITDISSRGTYLNDKKMKKGEGGSRTIFSSAGISLAGTTPLYITKVSEIKTMPEEGAKVPPPEITSSPTEKKRSKIPLLAISIVSMLLAMTMFFYPSPEEPISQLQWQENLTSDITDDVSILLKSDKPYAVVGEDFTVTLSVTNFPQNPYVILQLILMPPSGMVVSSTGLVKQGVGQYTATYPSIPPGGSKAIDVNVEPTMPGNYTIKGTVAYYFDDRENAKVYNLEIPVFVRETPVEKEEEPNYFIPLLLVISLISGGYYFKTTKRYEAEFEIKSKEILDEGEEFSLTLKVHNLMGNPKMVLQVIAKSTSEIEVLSKPSQKIKVGSGKSTDVTFNLRAEKSGEGKITLRLGYNIGGYKTKEKKVHRVRIREKF